MQLASARLMRLLPVSSASLCFVAALAVLRLPAQVAWSETRGPMGSGGADHLVFDPAVGRLVVLDRYDVGDAWEWTGTAWTRRTPATEPPRSTANYGACLAVDPIRRRIAAAVQGPSGWTYWEWDGTNWTQPVAGTPGMHVLALAYDPVPGRILALTATGTWSWDGIRWSLLGSLPPSWPAEVFTVVTDPQRRRVIAVGIDTTSAFPTSTWEWSGQSWIRMAAPPVVFGVLVFEPLRARTLLLDYFGSNWEWDGLSWRPSPVSGAPAQSSAVCHDPVRGRVVQFGGLDSASVQRQELWEWTGTAWSAFAAGPAQPSLFGTSLAYDSARQRVVAFGGGSADTWEWDGSTWLRFQVPGPSRRGGATLAYDSRRRRTVLFGGANGLLQYSNETWEWDGATWSQMQSAQQPPARASALLAFDSARGQIVVCHAG
jgi:hypothetical protein